MSPAISAPFPWLTILISMLFGQGKNNKSYKIYRRKFYKRLTITKQGKLYIVILLLIAGASINSGNNLLYLIVATLLSLIVISGVMSEQTLKKLTIKRKVPQHIFAGSPATIKWRISNGKAYSSSYSIVARELPTVNNESNSGYAIKIGSGSSVSISVPYTFTQRGEHRLSGFEISTKFPFGLFNKYKRYFNEETLLVYPRIRPLQSITAKTSPNGENRRHKKGSGSQPHTLRDYIYGDDAKIIHWKSTARAGKTMAMQFEEEGKKKVMLLFENYCSPGEEATLEPYVEQAASLSHHLINRGYSVGMKTLTSKTSCHTGKKHLLFLLRELALLKPVTAPGATPSIRVLSV